MSEALVTHANQTIEAGSKSFATAARLFDPATRRSAVMLYAWCRYCDDVVDGQTLGFADQPDAERQSPDGRQRLAELRDLTRRAYAGEPMTLPAFAAFQEVVQRHAIAERYPQQHLDGFAMDVQGERYETLHDTLRYCYGVAGVVGIMMARIMGVKEETTLDRACDLGLAFQLTNIARDIVEDAGMNRCYLPTEWLHEAGIPADKLVAPEYRPALAGLAARLVETAEPYYHSARGGLGALPLRSAWAIATAHGVYREIGIKVKARGPHAWEERISTSKADKLRLLTRGAWMTLSSRGETPAPRPASLWRRPL
ncbi:15-cis-phytoene synthase CrtB [Halomonas korlensis]|uniref:Phytoene synthase n=1 Tax=Halomonas korlensis TaxID=463301 RepID=A0A1I7IY64_9GAMM|nr:15-cis-phytoene synthase CrtB [Halomonas korlensis]SFU77893.1 phytoene synthase [Halomonas korlensis]